MMNQINIKSNGNEECTTFFINLLIKEKLIPDNKYDLEAEYTHEDILKILYENDLENKIFVINDNCGLNS